MSNAALFYLRERTAIVTGAARGVGEAIARELATMGAHVVLVDIAEEVHNTALRIVQEGGSAQAEIIDVTDSNAVDSLVKRIVAEHGALDIGVANAGVSYESETSSHTDEQWRRVMNINLDGVFHCVRAFGNAMLNAGRGSIIGISSIAGVKAVRPEVHLGYDVSKAGVAHLCRVTGVEWAAQGVRVNAVGPGYTNTLMLQEVGANQPEVMQRWLDDMPIGRLMEPREIASTVSFLASDAASGITGQLLMVDGGYSAS